MLLIHGHSDLDVGQLAVPLLDIAVSPDKPWTWNYTVTPQSNLNGRTFPYQRGKVLGGTSSVNYMIINKGSTSEWDRIATVTGDSGCEQFESVFINFVIDNNPRVLRFNEDLSE